MCFLWSLIILYDVSTTICGVLTIHTFHIKTQSNSKLVIDYQCTEKTSYVTCVLCFMTIDSEDNNRAFNSNKFSGFFSEAYCAVTINKWHLRLSLLNRSCYSPPKYIAWAVNWMGTCRLYAADVVFDRWKKWLYLCNQDAHSWYYICVRFFSSFFFFFFNGLWRKLCRNISRRHNFLLPRGQNIINHPPKVYNIISSYTFCLYVSCAQTCSDITYDL